jgi:hypothetical protein
VEVVHRDDIDIALVRGTKPRGQLCGQGRLAGGVRAIDCDADRMRELD